MTRALEARGDEHPCSPNAIARPPRESQTRDTGALIAAALQAHVPSARGERPRTPGPRLHGPPAEGPPGRTGALRPGGPRGSRVAAAEGGVRGFVKRSTSLPPARIGSRRSCPATATVRPRYTTWPEHKPDPPTRPFPPTSPTSTATGQLPTAAHPAIPSNRLVRRLLRRHDRRRRRALGPPGCADHGRPDLRGRLPGPRRPAHRPVPQRRSPRIDIITDRLVHRPVDRARWNTAMESSREHRLRQTADCAANLVPARRTLAIPDSRPR